LALFVALPLSSFAWCLATSCITFFISLSHLESAIMSQQWM
jgi:hypothetical protein